MEASHPFILSWKEWKVVLETQLICYWLSSLCANENYICDIAPVTYHADPLIKHNVALRKLIVFKDTPLTVAS